MNYRGHRSTVNAVVFVRYLEETLSDMFTFVKQIKSDNFEMSVHT